ncbi:unnamed protein product [Clavelina lepadiformis]|uniref:ATP synthase F0 subunit 8 n=1 Tax=Clavelina lepadiformis TaxID=159417 RepID=A0ABP0GD07_CLALP
MPESDIQKTINRLWAGLIGFIILCLLAIFIHFYCKSSRVCKSCKPRMSCEKDERISTRTYFASDFKRESFKPRFKNKFFSSYAPMNNVSFETKSCNNEFWI